MQHITREAESNSEETFSYELHMDTLVWPIRKDVHSFGLYGYWMQSRRHAKNDGQ